MSKILIIGNGYLGSHLAKILEEEGHHVHCASKHGTGDCLEVDLGSAESVAALAGKLDSTPDWIVHCASSSRGGPEAYRQVFVEGIANLTSQFPDRPVILTSSTSVYPQTDGEWVTEESPAQPDRQTGKYLREAEEILTSRGGTALRLAGIYGPDRSVHLKKMLEGTATIESGEVSRWLNQIHRDDAADAIAHIIRTGAMHTGQIYNVADDSPISQRECYEKLAEILDKPVPGESPPDVNRKRAWTHKKVSNEKIKSTGWTPRFPSFLRAVVDDKRLLKSQ